MFQKSPIALAIAALTTTAALSGVTHADEERHPEKAYERIVVTASPLDRTALESAQPIYILSGDELRESEAATLGETLRNLPGVQSTYFGPVSSSPVIRGLEGPRVKIVQNGLDVADISRGGPDHAVTTESSTAQQIEILRGPSTLLFGSGASGGVVNVVDNRVPRQRQEELTGHYSAGYSTVANERNASVALNAGNGDFAWHIDGFWRKAGDYDVPEFQDHDGHTSDHIENSFTDDFGATIGASYFFNRGFMGVSYGRMERQYGLPGHDHGGDDHDDHGHDDHDDHGNSDHADIFADVVQDRFQFLSGFENPFSGIDSIEINLGYTELSHDEIEDGFVESGFALEQTELRIIAHHAPIAGWRGAFGIQASQQEYDSFGVEAFTPHTDTESLGAFWMLEQRIGDITWEFGGRIERVELDSDGLETISYTPVSFSFGSNYHLNSTMQFSTHISYSERAPQATELFANGPHFATRTYEVGGIYEVHEEHGHDDHGHDDHGQEYHLALSSTALAKEKSSNLDFGFHYDGDRFHMDANVFFNRIDNFVYQHNTGIIAGMLDADVGLHGHDDHDHDDHGHDDHGHDHDHSFDDLPVYIYQQQDADLYGYELAAVYELTDRVNLRMFSDYTRASFRDGGNVPRIPAQRFGISAKYTEQNWDARVGYTQYMAQNKTGDNEERTSGFGLLNAYFNYYPGYFGNQDIAIYVKAENLTNELGFAHNSFIKEYAPMPGRNFGIGLRARF